MLSDNWLKAKYIDLRRSDVLLRELLGGAGGRRAGGKLKGSKQHGLWLQVRFTMTLSW